MRENQIPVEPAFGNNLAVVHDGQTVAKVFRFFHVVRGEDDGHAFVIESFSQAPRCCAWPGDRDPVVGSSKNRTFGSCTSAQAMEKALLLPAG